MALGGFATGALVTAPVVATLTWLAVTWQQHVDVRVERDTVVARADRSAFNAKFENDWSAASGQPKAACDPQAAAELARLRARAVELEAKLQGSTDDLDANARYLRTLMKETTP